MLPFDFFCERLETVFSALHKQPGYNIVKYNNLRLGKEKDKIFVYEQTKINMIAYFIPEKSWIDNAKLFDKLTDMMPDFIPYFRNEKNLIRNEDWPIVDESLDPEI